jgi:hypothetical protein
MEPERCDPRTVFVRFQSGRIFMSVPLRNVGKGTAVIADGVTIEGDAVGPIKYSGARRGHVPVGETTRIDLIASYDWAQRVEHGSHWLLTVPTWTSQISS